MKKTKSNKLKIVYCIVGGILIGFINGFFGGGGGMIVVPLLIFLLGLEEKEAHATAIFIILPLSIASSVIYITKNSLNYINLLTCGTGVILGGIIGALLLNKMNNKAIRIIFSGIMIIAGIKMMFS